MGEVKDKWDKAEIIGNIAAKLLIPVVVAGTVLWWNSERTKADSAAKMTEIAISILVEEPSSDEQGVDPMRLWAVDVLQNPSDPPPLSDAAAAQLSQDPLRITRLEMQTRIAEAIFRTLQTNPNSFFDDRRSNEGPALEDR